MRIYIWYATIVLFVAMGCVLKTNIFVFIVRLLESFAWKIEIIVNYFCRRRKKLSFFCLQTKKNSLYFCALLFNIINKNQTQKKTTKLK